VPSGPYVRPIKARPSAIVTTAPAVPAAKIGAITKPKTKIDAVIQSSARRRPRSARIAESGMVSAKKKMVNNCISRNFSRL